MAREKNVLIIDDEKEFLNVIKDVLDTRGFSTETAESAVEGGLKIAAKKPSLILMDLKMPGIDGFQACAALKRNPDTKDIPIIVVSALSDDASIKKALSSGVNKYFIKPVKIDDMIKSIDSFIADDMPLKGEGA